MPEGKGYDNPTLVLSPGLELSHVSGKYWGAWSGNITTNSSTATALDLRTPKKALKVLFSWATDFDQIANGATYQLEIKVSGQSIYRFRSKNEAGRASSDWDPIYMLIPPLSTVLVEVYHSNASNVIWTINMVAKEI